MPRRSSASTAGGSRSARTPTARVSNLYRVGGCPTVAFAYPGGILREAVIGSEALSEAEADRRRRARCCASPRGARSCRDERAPRPSPQRRLGGRSSCARSSPASRCASSRSSAARGARAREVKERLRVLSDRFSGAQAINLRQQPIPWAYRVFYRHIGLDPDEQLTPVEELALERMKHGAFRSHNLLDDALTIAIIESGVATARLRRRRVTGPLGIRLSAPGEELEGRPGELPAGHPGDRRRRAPAGAAVRRPGGRPGRDLEDEAHDPGRDRRSAACRRSRSRRRSGWPPGSCAGRIGAVGDGRKESLARTARAPAIRITPLPGIAAPTEDAKRRARDDLRRQIARLERELGELFASAFPRRGIDWGIGAVGGPRVLTIGELERIRDALVAAVARRAGRARPTRRRRGGEPGPARANDRRARAAPLGDRLQPGHRRARLPALALAPALGAARNADGLVADPALLRLSR